MDETKEHNEKTEEQSVIRQSECVHDTNNDGDCYHCVHRGGCSAIGGPFIKCIDCGKIKPNSEIMIRQPYCRECY